jgi:hypothetical protein
MVFFGPKTNRLDAKSSRKVSPLQVWSRGGGHHHVDFPHFHAGHVSDLAQVLPLPRTGRAGFPNFQKMQGFRTFCLLLMRGLLLAP